MGLDLRNKGLKGEKLVYETTALDSLDLRNKGLKEVEAAGRYYRFVRFRPEE